MSKAKFKNVELCTISLIQQTETGRILQIGLTEEQSRMLHFLLASMSTKESPLVQMGEEHDLVLKHNLCRRCQSKYRITDGS